MWEFNEVVSIKYRHRHVYRVAFDGGLEGDVDFAEYLDSGPVFEPLKDLVFFRQARIEGGTMSWPNGARHQSSRSSAQKTRCRIALAARRPSWYLQCRY